MVEFAVLKAVENRVSGFVKPTTQSTAVNGGEANTMATVKMRPPTKSTPGKIRCASPKVSKMDVDSEPRKELARTKEQQRLVVMNGALQQLRDVIPNEYSEFLKAVSKDKMRTSKAQTIRFATRYIAALSRLLGRDVSHKISKDSGGLGDIPDYPQEDLLALIFGHPTSKKGKLIAIHATSSKHDTKNNRTESNSSFIHDQNSQEQISDRKRKYDHEGVIGSAKKSRSCGESDQESVSSDTESDDSIEEENEIARFEFLCTCRICEEDGPDTTNSFKIPFPGRGTLRLVTVCELWTRAIAEARVFH